MPSTYRLRRSVTGRSSGYSLGTVSSRGSVAPYKRRLGRKKRVQWARNRKNRLISKVLHQAAKKRFRINRTSSLVAAQTWSVEGNLTEIVPYNPAGTGAAPHVNQSRLKDRVFVEGFQLRIAFRSSLTQYGGVRIILFRNSSPSELFDTAGANNMFEGATFQDATPQSNYTGLTVQPFNWDLVRSRKDLLLDKFIPLGTTGGDEDAVSATKHMNVYIPFNHLVEFESDPTVVGSGTNKVWTYMVLMGCASDALSGGGVGFIGFDYYIDTIFVEDM